MPDLRLGQTSTKIEHASRRICRGIGTPSGSDHDQGESRILFKAVGKAVRTDANRPLLF
jgi:hypothetical protein